MGLVVTLAGCAMLPGSGPREQSVRSSAAVAARNPGSTVGYDYVLVDLTRGILPLLSGDPTDRFRSFGLSARDVPAIRLGPGDVVRVTVFESQPGGLFIPQDAGARPGNFVQLPPQRVDQGGRITVPFAGAITAAGQTTSEVEAIIRDRLVDRAIEPEISVEIVEQNFSRFSIISRTGGSGVFPLREGGVRLLEAIAGAGGIATPASGTFISLKRGNRITRVAFQAILDNPAENIFLAPGDVVEIISEPRRFFAFGATGLVGQFDFDDDEVSLNDAVSRAASLQDNQADPRNVLIYRRESRAALARMGIDLSGIGVAGDDIPTIFRANFRSPDIFFLADEFRMRDGDVIFVTNALATEVQRFFTNATTVTGGPVSVRDNIESF